MCKNDKALGPFWVVWDKIVGPTEPFDSDKVTRGPQFWTLDVDLEEAWEKVRKENQYPNKPYDHYPRGEVRFDVKKHRFSVTGSPKLMHDVTFQRRIIKQYGLNSFTEFVKE